MLYFEGFKEFRACAVIGNAFSIRSREWKLISHVRMVTLERQPAASALIVLRTQCPLEWDTKWKNAGGKRWNLKLNIALKFIFQQLHLVYQSTLNLKKNVIGDLEAEMALK